MLLALLAAVMLAVFAAPAATAAPQDANYEAGASIGLWLPGTIDIDGFEADKDAGFLLRAFADMYVAPKFAVGAYFNYTSSEVEGWTVSSVEFGMALKPRFFLSQPTGGNSDSDVTWAPIFYINFGAAFGF